MNRLKIGIAALLVTLPLLSCASYNAYQKAQSAEKLKEWDSAVVQYEKALEIDPGNMRYKIALQRTKLEASRVHFQKGKTLLNSAAQAAGNDRIRLAQLAVTELELTVKLDPTNQFAATEYGHAVRMIQDTLASMSNCFLYARFKWSSSMSTLRGWQRATMQPPKPPPVILAP